MIPGGFFGRVAEIQIDRKGSPVGLSLDGLRIEFSITKNKDDNVATAKIYNAADTTISNIVSGAILTITAGYEFSKGLLYSGEIIRAATKNEGPDRFTEIECRAGAFSLRSGSFSFSYGRGASAFGVLRDLGARIGIPISLSLEGLKDKPYTNGYAYHGTPLEALREVSERIGARVILYDGAVKIADKNEATPSTIDVILLGPDSGLIGSPSRLIEDDSETEPGAKGKKKKQKEGYTFESLIDPRIVYGGVVMLSSETIPGGASPVTIAEIRVVGDTHGESWKMELKGYDRK